MRAWMIFAILLTMAVSAAPADHADAQSLRCRYDDSGTVCVCRRGSSWRISPPRQCRRSFEPEPERPRSDPPSRQADRDRPRLVPPSRTSRDAPPASAIATENDAEREDIAKIQRVLNAMGCDAGTADGVIGRATRAAIRCFQAGALQPITGQLTAEESEALLDAEADLPMDSGALLARLRQQLSGEEQTAERVEESGAPSNQGGGLSSPEPPAPDTAPPSAEDLSANPPAPALPQEDRASASPNAPKPDPAAEAGTQAAPPPQFCDDGFSDGIWTYRLIDGSPGAVAIARNSAGKDVTFVVKKGTISWSITLQFDDGAYVQTIIDEAQYLFIQTDKPAALGFEDVSRFEGKELVIPIGTANTVAMLGSRTLTVSAAARQIGPKGDLTLFDLVAVGTRGLGRVMSCF